MAENRNGKLSPKCYIVISGIDGAGKTTIIEGLRERLQANGLKTHYIWLRYNHIIVKPIHAFCRLVGLSRWRQGLHGKVWRHEFYRSRLFCSFYILMTWLDTLLSRWKIALKLFRKEPDVVICDRWVNDILIDLAVDTRREWLLESKWYSRFQRLVPDGAVQILIVRELDSILACRPEYRDDPDFTFRQKMYHRLRELLGPANVVSNDSTVSEAVDYIVNRIGCLNRNNHDLRTDINTQRRAESAGLS